MKVVIDTNVFCEDYLLKGAHFRLFFESLASVPASLHIPEVVIDELANRYKEDLSAALEREGESRSAVKRLVGDSTQLPHIGIDVKLETARIRTHIENTVKEHGAILPYPEVPHKKLVERDLSRRKPFKRDGSGYRDALIWESIRKLLLWGVERVVFVTNNPKDFGEGPLVDADLQKDMLNPTNLTVVRSIREFNERYILPNLRMLDAVRAALQSESSQLRLQRWLTSNLMEILRNNACLAEIVLDFPPRVGSAYPLEIVAFEKLKVSEVRELDSGEKLVELRVEAQVEFSIDVDWDDYIHHEEVREWAGDSEPFFSSSTHQVEHIGVDLELTVDLSADEITAYDVLSIDTGYVR